MVRPRVLVINGALQGNRGNTAGALKVLREALGLHARISTLTLAQKPSLEKMQKSVQEADAFIFATGTHWDSWSSHLQQFLELMTPLEATEAWLGKPAGCLITEHSVGGKAVLSRLQGVLVTLGCQIPPMSGVVLSLSAQLAAKGHPVAAKDFWCNEDLEVVCLNLLNALTAQNSWASWPVDRRHLKAKWWKPVSS